MTLVVAMSSCGPGGRYQACCLMVVNVRWPPSSLMLGWQLSPLSCGGRCAVVAAIVVDGAGSV